MVSTKVDPNCPFFIDQNGTRIEKYMFGASKESLAILSKISASWKDPYTRSPETFSEKRKTGKFA